MKWEELTPERLEQVRRATGQSGNMPEYWIALSNGDVAFAYWDTLGGERFTEIDHEWGCSYDVSEVKYIMPFVFPTHPEAADSAQ